MNAVRSAVCIPVSVSAARAAIRVRLPKSWSSKLFAPSRNLQKLSEGSTRTAGLSEIREQVRTGGVRQVQRFVSTSSSEGGQVAVTENTESPVAPGRVPFVSQHLKQTIFLTHCTFYVRLYGLLSSHSSSPAHAFRDHVQFISKSQPGHVWNCRAYTDLMCVCHLRSEWNSVPMITRPMCMTLIVDKKCLLSAHLNLPPHLRQCSQTCMSRPLPGLSPPQTLMYTLMSTSSPYSKVRQTWFSRGVSVRVKNKLENRAGKYVFTPY